MNNLCVGSDLYHTMAECGLQPANPKKILQFDGKLQVYFPVSGGPFANYGWMVSHAMPMLCVTFGRLSSETVFTWPKYGQSLLSGRQRQTLKKLRDLAVNERKKHALRCQLEEAASVVEDWALLDDANDALECLRSRHVGAFGIKYDTDDGLLIPMRDISGKMWSFETEARLSNFGVSPLDKKGTFHLIGDAQCPNVIVATDYLSAAALHQATGDTVAMAGAVSNVAAVVLVIRRRHPRKSIVIAMDAEPNSLMDSRLRFESQVYAAAFETGARVVWPGCYQGDWAPRVQSFYQLYRSQGAVAVADTIRGTSNAHRCLIGISCSDSRVN